MLAIFPRQFCDQIHLNSHEQFPELRMGFVEYIQLIVLTNEDQYFLCQHHQSEFNLHNNLKV